MRKKDKKVTDTGLTKNEEATVNETAVETSSDTTDTAENSNDAEATTEPAEATDKKAEPAAADNSEEKGAEESTTEAKAEDAESTADATTDEQPALIETDTAKVDADTVAEATEPSKEKTPATWPGKLALVLSIAALGCAGYLYWQGMQMQTSSQSQANDLQQTVETQLARQGGEVSGAISAVKSQLQTLQSSMNSERKEVEVLQQRLTQSIQQVTANQPNTRNDWLLAEIEYLLRLANQRVLMEKTADGALTLLNAADDILKEMDDVSIYNVREALAKDIAALEAVPELDDQGIFLKLSAMNGLVDKLKRLPLKEQRELPEMLKQITPDAVSEGWVAGMADSWSNAMDKLGALVIIQNTDDSIKPLLSPEQMFYLQQNLRLMLEQAQLSVLQGKQGTFDASLEKADLWLANYFDPNDSATKALRKNVAALKGTNVNPEMPDISGSLTALKSYLLTMAKLKQEGASQ